MLQDCRNVLEHLLYFITLYKWKTLWHDSEILHSTSSVFPYFFHLPVSTSISRTNFYFGIVISVKSSFHVLKEEHALSYYTVKYESKFFINTNTQLLHTYSVCIHCIMLLYLLLT